MESREMLTCVQIGVSAIGLGLVFWQLRENAFARQKTHEWNRMKATQDACKDFLAPQMFAHWQKLSQPITVEKKAFGALTTDELVSLRAVLSFLESMAILINKGIVEKSIVFEHFETVWRAINPCATDFVKDIQKVRGDKQIYENFAAIAAEIESKTVVKQEAKQPS